MPSYVTHHQFADAVLQASEDSLRHAIDAAQTAYFWGAQGPDPLFFHAAPFSGKVKKLGHCLHRFHIASVFNAMTAQTRSDPVALAYVLGFATHYCLDRTTHPYIEDQVKLLVSHYPDYDESACHKLCEADIDASIIAEYISGDQQNFKAYHLLKPEDPCCRTVAKMLVTAATACGKRKLNERQALASLTAMHRVCRLLHGGEPTRRQLAALEQLIGKKGAFSVMLRPNNPLPEDCLNTGRRQWTAPDGSIHSETFFELTDAAQKHALSLCRAIYKSSHKRGPIDARFFPTDYSGHKV